MLQDTVKYPQKWIILFLSNVLKKLILKDWKYTHPLWLLYWKKEMCYYLNMEGTIATEKNKLTKTLLTIILIILQALSL